MFQQARKENKLVLLDLEAVWCHWCHVMDKQTYRDPKVISLLKSHFIAVKVDQDSRPELATRYEDYGWPATILYNSKGQEIAKLSGYIAPGPFADTLEAFIKDPTPGPSITAEAKLHPAAQDAFSTAVLKDLNQRYAESYDFKSGGFGYSHKYVQWDAVEWAMKQARAGGKRSKRFEKMAKTTLSLGRKLIDPQWGGAYQYSVDNVWTHPHFEKIMEYQAGYLRIYSLAYNQWSDKQYLATARSLFTAALKYPGSYRRIEWWDKSRDKSLPNNDVSYPQLSKAAAFACSGTRCSLPIFQSAELRVKLDRLLASG